jgi:Uma2 family endonuclease
MEVVAYRQPIEYQDSKHSEPQVQRSKEKPFNVKKMAQNPFLLLTLNGAITFKSKMTKTQFNEFVLTNEVIKIERDKHGTITIHPPLTFESGYDEGEAFYALKLWSKSNRTLGRAYSPSTSINLPDGSQFKADGAWFSTEKIDLLSQEERQSIPTIVPDFVIEFRSKTDSLIGLKKKMNEAWMANGVKLAWLIDPKKKNAWVYRIGNTEPEEVNGFENILSGEDILPNFEFNLREMM